MTQEQKEKIRKQAHEILDLVLDGNGFERRTHETTGELPTYFLQFSGHINRLEVQINRSGWSPGLGSETVLTWKMDNPLSYDFIEKLKARCSIPDNNDIIQSQIDRSEKEIAAAEEIIAKEKEIIKQLKKRFEQ